MLIGYSDKEVGFLRALALGAKPCAAVRLAGYRSKASARNLLRKRHVQAGVRELADHLLRIVAKLDAA
jgi:hypothetical protein